MTTPADSSSGQQPLMGPDAFRGLLESVPDAMVLTDASSTTGDVLLRGDSRSDSEQAGGAAVAEERGAVPPDRREPDRVHRQVDARRQADVRQRSVRVLYPACRVVFMSGYNEDAVVHHGLDQSTHVFLQKPFTPLILARKLRDVLDHHG
jgi:hypothetical protein